jgi:hypothetical protein
MLSQTKFQIGDYVIGTKEATAHYAITKEGWTGQITEIRKYTIMVYGKDNCDRDRWFEVEPKYFESCDSQNFNQNEFQQIL